MYLAMEAVGMEPAMREKLLASFFNTADFMRNQPT
jgi:truncated hemoglobin YjbI